MWTTKRWIRTKLSPSSSFKQLSLVKFLKWEQKVRSFLEMCRGQIHLWYYSTNLHGNTTGMCKAGSSLQTAMAYRADMPSFYLKIIWVTSVLCATGGAWAWQALLPSQNRRCTRSVVSVDFLLQIGLGRDTERVCSEVGCIWTHLSLAHNFRKMGECQTRWSSVTWKLAWKDLD